MTAATRCQQQLITGTSPGCRGVAAHRACTMGPMPTVLQTMCWERDRCCKYLQHSFCIGPRHLCHAVKRQNLLVDACTEGTSHIAEDASCMSAIKEVHETIRRSKAEEAVGCQTTQAERLWSLQAICYASCMQILSHPMRWSMLSGVSWLSQIRCWGVSGL